MGERSGRRARARYAGQRSGRARRRFARIRRGYLPGQLDAPLTFEIRGVTREDFDRRYEKVSPQPERPSAAVQWERKREAVWQHCISSERLVRARGQHCGTTRARRARGLELRGHKRGDRTIYTYNQLLAAMAIAGFQHVKTPPGARDYLRVEWRVHRRLPISPCRQPCGTGDVPSGESPDVTSKTLIPPPTAADEAPPDKPGARPGTDEEALEAEIEFKQLKLELGWGDQATIRAEIALLRRQLSGQDRSRIASTTSDGFKCST